MERSAKAFKTNHLKKLQINWSDYYIQLSKIYYKQNTIDCDSLIFSWIVLIKKIKFLVGRSFGSIIIPSF